MSKSSATRFEGLSSVSGKFRIDDCYSLIETMPLSDYMGEGRLYEHRASGFRVFHLKNSDPELFASFAFKTLAENGTGAAHIIEHTVLCGSRNFPIKDPFMTVSTGSANSFLNAFTAQGYTCYPFASPVVKDFDNIFEVYADAVFCPLLREESFLQEGIRQEGDRFDGVVFNEMKGARNDQDSIVAETVRTLFRGTPYFYSSGGFVPEIPDLSYTQYLELYRKWYSPSNGILFIYGNTEIEKYLCFLEKNYLYGAKRTVLSPVDTDPEVCREFEVRVPGPDAQGCAIGLSWLTGKESNPLDLITISVLVEILLGDAGNPLYRAMIESGLGEDICNESGMSSGYPRIPLTIAFSGAKEENAGRIYSFILGELERIAETGLDPLLVEACIKDEEFSLKEVQRRYYPIGFTAFMRLMRGFTDGTSLFTAVRTREKVELLRDAVKKDPKYFEHWILGNLVNNPRLMRFCVYPDPDFEKNVEQGLKGKIRPQTEEETASLKKRLADYADLKDSDGDLAKVGHLSLSDLGDCMFDFDSSSGDAAGRPLYRVNTFTNGICYFAMDFDTRDFTQREHQDLQILCRLISMTGLRDMDYSAVALKLRQLTGSFAFAPSCASRTDARPLSSATVLVKALKEDCVKALDFISDLIRNADIEDTGRLKNTLSDIRSSFKTSFMESGHSFAGKLALSGFAPALKESECTTGVTMWRYVDSIKDPQIDELRQRLSLLRSKLCDRRRLGFELVCMDEELKECTDALKSFAGSFPDSGKEVTENSEFYTLRPESGSTGLEITGQVAYNAAAVGPGNIDEKGRMARMLLSAVLSDYNLWDAIRTRGGAYMGSASQGLYTDTFCFYTYRDPRIAESIRDCIRELELIAKENVKEDVLTSEKINVLGRELRPRSPMDILSELRKRSLQGLSRETVRKRMDYIKEISVSDIGEAAGELHVRFKNARVVSAASKTLLKENGITETVKLKF